MGIVTSEVLERYRKDVAFLEKEKKECISVLKKVETQLAQKRLFIHQIIGCEDNGN